MRFDELLQLTQTDIESMVQSGIFNQIIQGYCIMAMKQAGFTQQEIERLDFCHLFDSISAWDAARAAEDDQERMNRE